MVPLWGTMVFLSETMVNHGFRPQNAVFIRKPLTKHDFDKENLKKRTFAKEDLLFS